jgi:signal transduction histidine kinase
MDHNEAALLLDMLIKLFNMDGGTLHRVNGFSGNGPPFLVASRGWDTMQEIIEHLFEMDLVEYLQKLRQDRRDDLCLDMALIGSYFPGVNPFLHARQVKSLLLTPLFHREQLVGVMSVFGRNYTALEQGDTELLASISNRLGHLLKDLETGVEELPRTAARAGWRLSTMMDNLLRISAGAESLEDCLSSALELLANGLHTDMAFLIYQDPLQARECFRSHVTESLLKETPTPSREFVRMAGALQQLTLVRPESPVMTGLPAAETAAAKMFQALLVPARSDDGSSILACLYLQPGQRITQEEMESLQPLISLLLNQAQWMVSREREREQLRALEILTDMAGELAICDTGHRGMALLARKCLDILDCDRTAVFMLNEEVGLYETVVQTREGISGDDFSLAYGPRVAAALRRGFALIEGEAENLDVTDGGAHQPETVLILPLVGRDARLGALVLEKREGFSRSDDLPGRLARAVAGQATVLLERRRERLSLERTSGEVDFVSQLNQRLFHAQTLEELGVGLYEELRDHLGVEMLLISWPDSDLPPSGWHDGRPVDVTPMQSLVSGGSIISLNLAREGYYICNNLNASLRTTGEQALARLYMRSCAAVPLRNGAGTSGMLMVAATRGGAFDEESIVRLRQVTDMLVSAARLPALYDKLENEHTRLTEAYDELEKVIGVQGDLLHIAAHEIRSPLTLIMGFAEVMRDYYDSMDLSERNRVVDRLLRSVDRLRRSVINMLELSQLEAGQFSIQADYFDMPALLNELVEDFKPRSIPCRLEMLSNGDMGPVFADRDKIEIVLFNLIDNAIKFSHPGSRIGVSCRRDGDRVILEVSDEGRGIGADFVEAVFEPFERGEEAQRVTAQGMGLGLYIVKKLVEAHGGEVQLKTTPGEGSTFAIIIPQDGRSGGSFADEREALQA